MKRLGLIGFTLLSSLAMPALAGQVDGNAVLGGMLGGGAGAALGSAIGGKDGAVIGAGMGAAAGAAVAADGRSQTAPVQRQVVYMDGDRHEHHDNGLHRGWYKQEHERHREDRDHRDDR